MDPTFLNSLKQAYREGEVEREKQHKIYRENQKKLCDRGVVEIQKIFGDPKYQQEAQTAFRKHESYCIPFPYEWEPRLPIRYCLETHHGDVSQNHTECKRLREMIRIVGETDSNGKYNDHLCLSPDKFRN